MNEEPLSVSQWNVLQVIFSKKQSVEQYEEKCWYWLKGEKNKKDVYMCA